MAKSGRHNPPCTGRQRTRLTTVPYLSLFYKASLWSSDLAELYPCKKAILWKYVRCQDKETLPAVAHCQSHLTSPCTQLRPSVQQGSNKQPRKLNEYRVSRPQHEKQTDFLYPVEFVIHGCGLAAPPERNTTQICHPGPVPRNPVIYHSCR